MAKTVADAWAEFSAIVIPPGALAVQRTEMRKAFYAGFVQAIGLLTVVADQNSEEDAAAIVSALFEECVQFLGVRHVKGGA